MNVDATDHPATRAERCLGHLCSPATGLEFRQPDRGTGEFAITELTTAAVERVVPDTGDEPISVTVGGGGTTASAATLTALGEFIERYSMYWPLADRVDATHAELCAAGECVVHLEFLRVWPDDELEAAGFETFDADTTTEWVPGTTLSGGDEVLVPTDLVSFAHAHRDGASLPESTSGNACGSSLAGALVRSLNEQVERDAVMRTWYECRTPTRLDISALEELDAFRRRITPAGYQLHVLELPTPTDCAAVATMLVNNADRVPKFRLFAGAHRSLDGAIQDALSETAEGLLQTKYQLATGDIPDPDIDVDSVYDFDRNVQYYMRPENFTAVAHLQQGDVRTVSREELVSSGQSQSETPSASDESASLGEETTFDDPRRELERTLAAVRANKDLTPIAVDLTPADVRELGLYATAVYVPGLVDITPPALAPVDHPALDRIENRDPHPFP
ncbi:YcaO-like family protein [Haloarchaeobius sp. DYHT-AS-18]|uniref:YcaO-like family protein n=1 Tax=Haloarchaeobius sp. DYHT-AS-18 TaxID=3446117 RepID=UPI003EBF85E2